jgi:hypothetical protein
VGNHAVGMVHCQTAHQINSLFVSSDSGHSGNSPDYVQFGHSAGLLPQNQMGFALFRQDIDFNFLK